MLSYMNQYSSTELTECFDRIIGKNIDSLSNSEIFIAYASFMTASRAQVRPKILSLLIKRIS